MHRYEIAHWIGIGMLGLFVVTVFLHLFPFLNPNIPLGLGLALGLVWAWMLSTTGKPVKLTPELAALNVTSGSFSTKTGILLVGDSWSPKDNREQLRIAQPGSVEFTVTVKDRVVTELLLRASGKGFEPTETVIAVDTGHVVFLDAAWDERGLSAKSIFKDVQAVLGSPEPLHLLVLDSSGEPAGLVVGSGLGDGQYLLKAEGSQARIEFEPEEEPPDQDDG